MQKHLTHIDLKKIIKKDKRRSKKTLFVLLQKPMDSVSIFYKEPQQEKKLFIAFDVVVNLDIFDQQNSVDVGTIFSDFNMWRVPIKIEKRYTPNSNLLQLCQLEQVDASNNSSDNYLNEQQISQSQSKNNLSCNSHCNCSEKDIQTDSHLITEDNHNDIFKDNNFLVEVELDTHATGTKMFIEFTKILNSISNQKAHKLAEMLVIYQDFVNKCLANYHLYQKSLTRILPNLQEENHLDILLQEMHLQSYMLASQIIQQKIQQHRYVSYLIKVNKEGQQVIQKFGYSKAFLDVMGIEENYEQFFMRQGPINPFNPRNRLDRLITGLHKKALGYPKAIRDKYEDQYFNEEIYTIDNFVFKANYKNEKYFLNKSEQYFVKSSFLLQISTYDISDDTVRQINRIRQQSKMNMQSQRHDQDKEIQNLQYSCESEIFLNKYYILNKL